MSLTYGSVCSGIEGASVAWEPLGFTPLWFAEVDPFCNAVLAHHYAGVPNYGDFTQLGRTIDVPRPDILIGGTPCQSFSVAGLRAGMADPRGNLALEYLALVDRLRPRWLVWENVPGVLSSNRGRDFGAFLGALAELGYGFAYLVLDAQYFGVPQRRRRLILVGHSGACWQRPAAVLFERESLLRHPAPRRESRASVAALTSTGVGVGGPNDNQAQAGHLIESAAFGGNNTAGPIDLATACNAHGGTGRLDFESETFIATIEAPIAFISKDDGGDASKLAPTLRCGGGDGGAMTTAIAYQCQGTNVGEMGTLRSGNGHTTGGVPFLAHTLRADGFDASEDGTGRGTPLGTSGVAVRRLTATECARLQGFPDTYLDISYRGKPVADGPKYRSLGNSFAVPVIRWVVERIALVESLVPLTESEAA